MDLKELQEIKEKAQKETSMRKTEAKKKVVVGMGTCGIAAGARPVLNAFVEEVNRRDLDDVMVTQAGCKGFCSREPIVDIVTEEGETTYGDVDPEKVKRIVEEHLVKGNVVEEYVLRPE
ncbi:MAG: (2Fe-2S) ferredoxin domain-containing protein [Candidatus Acetothermia bacterium]